MSARMGRENRCRRVGSWAMRVAMNPPKDHPERMSGCLVWVACSTRAVSSVRSSMLQRSMGARWDLPWEGRS